MDATKLSGCNRSCHETVVIRRCIVNVKEAAQELGISTSLLYALVAAKKIRHERHGIKRGKIVIPEAAIEEYRTSRTVEASSVPPQQAQKPVTQPRAHPVHIRLKP